MKRVLLVFTLFCALVSCSNDPYDTGDGSLSLMRADFGEAETDASSGIVSILTDDGDRLMLTRSVRAPWAEKPDTAYRALIYYNKVKAEGGFFQAEPLALSQVLTPEVTAAGDVEGGVKTDPVVFRSAWMSRNGKYINLDLEVKTGSVDGIYGAQTVGIVHDGTGVTADGTRLVRLRLYHDQAGVPEYYSAKLYLSIPVGRLPVALSEGGRVEVCICTYGGQTVRTFSF